ncbi:hypothetical protein SLEP1_g42394 [Rubroshorea leprosula]|uniref:Uncharacterized protein n=1 Tax=Rubroshorea leprosula TaxID=152421 RepID=A0AAV5L9M7_9ROSI|nr:hypothetical protein SLEP1_g42394 [Rubroshorea leprosula]
MTEFSLESTAPTKKTTQFPPCLLLTNFKLFCSLILSHPLYFSYFIFFCPYLFRVLSFLSPLFITTSLWLLTLFTLLVNDGSPLELPESKVSFLLATYQTLVERFRSKVDDDQGDDFRCFEALEAYKIVFEMSDLEIGENPVEVSEMESKERCIQAIEASPEKGLGNLGELGELHCPEFAEVIVGVKSMVEFWHEKEVFENLPQTKGEKEVKSLISGESEKGEEEKEEKSTRRGSKAMDNKIREAKVGIDNAGQHVSKAMMNSSWRERGSFGSTDGDGLGTNLGSFGSMRGEKEWTRTLACKLYEERHNADIGGEGMDLLWETYETDSKKMQLKSRSKKGKKGSQKEYLDEDDNEDYEEDTDGQFCCLQALKFSAGKMNLGMRTPNLMKISKALKGIGWLHHVSNRNGKKGHR